jgi:hypothetical protein
VTQSQGITRVVVPRASTRNEVAQCCSKVVWCGRCYEKVVESQKIVGYEPRALGGLSTELGDNLSEVSYVTIVDNPCMSIMSLHTPLFCLLLHRQIPHLLWPQTPLRLSMRPLLLLPTPLQLHLALLIWLVSSFLQHLPFQYIPMNSGTVLPLGERLEFLQACKFH